jgi:hypothetical protein
MKMIPSTEIIKVTEDMLNHVREIENRFQDSPNTSDDVLAGWFGEQDQIWRMHKTLTIIVFIHEGEIQKELIKDIRDKFANHQAECKKRLRNWFNRIFMLKSTKAELHGEVQCSCLYSAKLNSIINKY